MGKRVIIDRGIGKLSLCPKCNGAMQPIYAEKLKFSCVDCRVRFVAVKEGFSDRELVCEEEVS